MPDFGMIFFWLLFKFYHWPFGKALGDLGGTIEHEIGEGVARWVEAGIRFVQLGFIVFLALPLMILFGWMAYDAWTARRQPRA